MLPWFGPIKSGNECVEVKFKLEGDWKWKAEQILIDNNSSAKLKRL